MCSGGQGFRHPLPQFLGEERTIAQAFRVGTRLGLGRVWSWSPELGL